MTKDWHTRGRTEIILCRITWTAREWGAQSHGTFSQE